MKWSFWNRLYLVLWSDVFCDSPLWSAAAMLIDGIGFATLDWKWQNQTIVLTWICVPANHIRTHSSMEYLHKVGPPSYKLVYKPI